MMDELERYMLSLVPQRSPVMERLEREAERDHVPIIGPYEGHLLYLLARMIQAREALELGTAIGYSALWLAAAVQPRGGQVITVERNPHMAARARANVKEAGYADVVSVVEGEAFDILNHLGGTFDFIFVDILRSFTDVESAPRLLEALLPHLRIGGLLVADNALHIGDPDSQGGTLTEQGIREYNRRAAQKPELAVTVLPVRDGISIALRLA
jgi:caffeoyl-CoA O-methyltransferase